jgi:hypothetical protein
MLVIIINNYDEMYFWDSKLLKQYEYLNDVTLNRLFNILN